MTGMGVGTTAVAVAGLRLAWAGERAQPETVVLDDFTLAVPPGSFTCIVGPSGCGKSTLLRVLAGLLVPDGGTAQVGGADVRGRPGACAWLPQRDNLLPWRRVLANATLGAEIGGRSRAEAEAEARPLLERFGLGGVERSWPSQLSGGMRQRLAVLRTFLIDSPVLLLDEPFGALDALTRRRMQTWLQEVWLDAPGERRTVLLVTHDVEEALLLGDRVVVLSERPGRIVADIEVGFARPRPAELVSDAAFVAQRAALLAALGA
ncbi:MAG: transporter related protein [Acidimicrobiales bacterium]|nr:transporter related protein [Acidimicrobiales bacterium]